MHEYDRKRRVKCGEERPQCLRCISGGYTCDSYNGGTSAARTYMYDASLFFRDQTSKPASDPVVFESLRRPSTALILRGDTSTNSRMLRRRTASTSPTASLLVSRVCRQISHQEVAVKHAMVALGSVCQLLQQKYPAKSNSTLENLELFTTGQYNKAPSRSQRLVNAGDSGNCERSEHNW